MSHQGCCWILAGTVNDEGETWTVDTVRTAQKNGMNLDRLCWNRQTSGTTVTKQCDTAAAVFLKNDNGKQQQQNSSIIFIPQQFGNIPCIPQAHSIEILLSSVEKLQDMLQNILTVLKSNFSQTFPQWSKQTVPSNPSNFIYCFRAFVGKACLLSHLSTVWSLTWTVNSKENQSSEI